MILQADLLAGGLISLAKACWLVGVAVVQGTELLSAASDLPNRDLNSEALQKHPNGLLRNHNHSFRGTSPLNLIQDVRYPVSADVPSHGSHDAADSGS